jgi:hypothetical protein
VFDAPFSFEQFARSPWFRRGRHRIRLESHPFGQIECASGYLKMQFSTSLAGESIMPLCKVVAGDSSPEIDRSLQEVELFQTTRGRRKFWLHAVFPNKAIYQLSVFIDSECQFTVFVDNKKPSSELPFLKYTAGDSAFIPISPKAGLTAVDSGIAVIRFAVSCKRSHLLVDVVDAAGNNDRRLADYVRLVIPFDPTRYEDVVAARFPETGEWRVTIYLANDEGSYAWFIAYRFDVRTAASAARVCALDYVANGREFAPLRASEKLSLNVTASAVVSTSPVFKVTAQFAGQLLLNLRPADGGNTMFPDTLSETTQDSVKTVTYSLTVQRPGDYELFYFLNGSYESQQTWRYAPNGLPAPTRQDGTNLEALRKAAEGIYDDPEFEQAKRDLVISVPDQPVRVENETNPFELDDGPADDRGYPPAPESGSAREPTPSSGAPAGTGDQKQSKCCLML